MQRDNYGNDTFSDDIKFCLDMRIWHDKHTDNTSCTATCNRVDAYYPLEGFNRMCICPQAVVNYYFKERDILYAQYGHPANRKEEKVAQRQVERKVADNYHITVPCLRMIIRLNSFI